MPTFAITSNYGPRELSDGHSMHTGIDLRAPQGTQVLSMEDGVVVRVVPPESGKNSAVEVQHPFGYRTRYVHLSAIAVALGQRVRRGQVVGLSGGAAGTPGAGRSTGPHLHLEMRRWDGSTWQLIDPTFSLRSWT